MDYWKCEKSWWKRCIDSKTQKWDPNGAWISEQHGLCWFSCVPITHCRLWTYTLPVRRCGWVDWGRRGPEASVISLTHTLLAFCKYRGHPPPLLCLLMINQQDNLFIKKRYSSPLQWIGKMLIVFLCFCSRWVNTLGMASVQGIDVVLRHSFFDYGYTHLVDQHFNPLPVSLSLSARHELEKLSIVKASIHASPS